MQRNEVIVLQVWWCVCVCVCVCPLVTMGSSGCNSRPLARPFLRGQAAAMCRSRLSLIHRHRSLTPPRFGATLREADQQIRHQEEPNCVGHVSTMGDTCTPSQRCSVTQVARNVAVTQSGGRAGAGTRSLRCGAAQAARNVTVPQSGGRAGAGTRRSRSRVGSQQQPL